MIEIKKPLLIAAYQDILYQEQFGNMKKELFCPVTYQNPFSYIHNASYSDGEKPAIVYYDETFKPYIECNRFLIGNHGTVYDTYSRTLNRPYLSGGYIHYYLSDFGRRSAHRMLMLTFDPIANAREMEVNHKDGIKHHNYWNPNPKLSNLEWVTPSQNIQHAYDTGLNVPSFGEDKYNAKYTNEEVTKICEMLQEGYSSSEIGKAIGRSGYNFLRFIHNLRNGIAWVWLTKDYDLKPAIRHTEEEIILICELLMTGISNEEISIKLKEDFGYDVLPGFIKTIRYGNENWAHIIQNYNFPSRLIRPYSEEDIHQFCQLLEQNKSFREISELTGFEYNNSLLNILKNLRFKNIYPDIVSQYNISSERKIKEKFTDAQVKLICELLMKGCTAKEIAEFLHIEFNQSIATIVSQIKNHKSFLHITSQYDFSKKKKYLVYNR